MKKKEIKEVVPEVARLRKVSSFKLKCTEQYEGRIWTKYIIAETKEDAIELLKIPTNFGRFDIGMVVKMPEIVSENSAEVKITNTDYENLMKGTSIDTYDPIEGNSLKKMRPSMTSFNFNFNATETIVNKFNDWKEIVCETKEDAIKVLKEKNSKFDLSDITCCTDEEYIAHLEQKFAEDDARIAASKLEREVA